MPRSPQVPGMQETWKRIPNPAGRVPVEHWIYESNNSPYIFPPYLTNEKRVTRRKVEVGTLNWHPGASVRVLAKS